MNCGTLLRVFLSVVALLIMIGAQVYFFIAKSPPASTAHYQGNLTDVRKPKLVKLSDQRLFAFDTPNITVSPKSHVVFLVHGFPGSRLWKHPQEREILAKLQAQHYHIRLVRFDRPGYGQSSKPDNIEERTVQDFVADFSQLVQKLNVKNFSLIGYSMGAPYALAVAADQKLSSQVHSLALIAPFGIIRNRDDLFGMCENNMKVYSICKNSGFLWHKYLFHSLSQLGLITHHTYWYDFFKDCLSADDKLLIEQNNDWKAVFNNSMIESYRQGTDILHAELRTLLKETWGFNLSKVHVPVTLYYGQEDLMVTENMSRFIKSKIPGSKLYLVGGKGHFSTFNETFEAALKAVSFAQPDIVLAANETVASNSSSSNSSNNKSAAQQEQGNKSSGDNNSNNNSNNNDKNENNNENNKKQQENSPNPTKADIKQEIKQDPVIIIGGGLAGLSAAIEAIISGVSQVYIFEKEARLGGNSAKASSGINGIFSQAQISQKVNDSVEAFTSDTIASGKGKSSQALVNVLVNQSTSAIQFLEQHAVNLDILSQCGGHSFPRTHRAKTSNDPQAKITNVGYDIMSSLEKSLKERYADKIKIMTLHRVTSLLTATVNGSPRVFGIKYQRVNDPLAKTLELKGKAVILTSGGFGADKSLLLKYGGEKLANLPTTNGAFTTGDGIKFAVDSIPNIELVDMQEIQVHPTCFVNPADPKAKSLYLAAEALRAHGGILLNQEGKRFVNELGYRDHVSEQIFKHCKPEIENGPVTSYMILNEEAAAEFGLKLLSFYQARKFVNYYNNFEEFSKDVKLDYENVKKTIEEYNEAATVLKKDEFNKTIFPTVFELAKPIYMMRITPGVHYTMGGVKINENAQVIARVNEKEVAIQGLYAAGEVTGGVHGKNRLAGNSLLECVVFGRIAAQSIIANLK